MNSLLIEFEGQLTLSDIHSLTKKEIYYLRKERQAYHVKLKEETDKAVEEAQRGQSNDGRGKKKTRSSTINQPKPPTHQPHRHK